MLTKKDSAIKSKAKSEAYDKEILEIRSEKMDVLENDLTLLENKSSKLEATRPEGSKKSPRLQTAARDSFPVNVAERQGFEPWVPFYQDNHLAGGCYRPLSHLSKSVGLAERKIRREEDSNLRDAEASNGFQDRRIRPLCHLSKKDPGRHFLITVRPPM